jgi:hypothetical protein
MRRLLVVAFAITCFTAFADDAAKVSKSSKWDHQNNPFRIDSNFNNLFSDLPLSGDTSKSGFGWPAYFWANNKGGIAQRWSSKKPDHFEYESPSLYKLKNMSEAQIGELSPAEKFDILNGRYDYPTVEKVWDQTKKGAKDWHGICHGAAPSGLHHKEPVGKTMINADGVRVNFHSSDIKALVAYYYAKISDLRSTQIGRRCNSGRFSPLRFRKACKDVHPAALHIIMTNRLGLTTKGFIADIDRMKAVWNHVAVKYDSVVKSTLSADGGVEGTAKRLIIESKVSYTGGVNPSEFAILGTENEKWDIRTYEYILDIDYKGQIIGGVWLSKQKPDFIWVKDRETFDDTYFGKVKELL